MKKLMILLLITTSSSLLCKAQDKDFEQVIYALDESGYQQLLCIFNNSKNAGAALSICYEGKRADGNTYGDYQYFQFKKTADGYYYIINSDNGLYLEPQSDPAAEGSKIVQASPRGNDRQKWQIIPGKRFYFDEQNELSYYIMPKLRDNLYITIKGASVVLSVFNPKAASQLQTFTFGDCFPADAYVTTEEGSPLPIGEAVKGTRILSYNNNTQKTEFAVVDTLLIHTAGDYELVSISFVKSDVLLASINPCFFIQTVDATANHPILTPSGYKPIGDISPEDIIYVYSGYEKKLTECVVLKTAKNVRTEERVYNLKLNNGNAYIVNSVVASPKCPYVSVITPKGPTEISEIMNNQQTTVLDMYDEVKIPPDLIKDTVLRIRIDERKDEISYIDQIYLRTGSLVIKPEAFAGYQKSEAPDEDYLVLEKGEFTDLTFYLPAGTPKGDIYIVVKGYYDTIDIAGDLNN